MIRKIGYGISSLVAWVATTAVVSAQTQTATCISHGQEVPCPSAASLLFVGIFALVIFLVIIVSLWIVFRKAGKPGWASIIPIYNNIVMIEIAERPIWWIILFFIPLVGAIMAIIVYNDIAVRFGKGVGFTIGLVIFPFIFLPILAFDKSVYQPQGMGTGMNPPGMPPQQPSAPTQM